MKCVRKLDGYDSAVSIFGYTIFGLRLKVQWKPTNIPQVFETRLESGHQPISSQTAEPSCIVITSLDLFSRGKK
jgi:hypothetical protein